MAPKKSAVEILADLASEEKGTQAPDLVFYVVVLAPIGAGVCGFLLYAGALVFQPKEPEERLSPLLWGSLALMGVPLVVEGIKSGG